MIRVTDTTLIDIIINHPDVRPTAQKGNDYLTAEALVNDPRNVVYASATGTVLFLYRGSGVYDGHIAFMPGYRGKYAIRATKDALDRLFREHGATKVLAATPTALPQVAAFTRRLGFKSLGVSEEKPVEYFELEADNGRFRR